MEEEFEHPLKKYLRKGEGEQIEFKQTLNDEFKIAKTICSLANTNGGIILIGIKDNKTIIGVDPEEEKFILQKAVEVHCKPPVTMYTEELYINEEANEVEKIILKVNILKSGNAPHYAENRNGDWLSYIRYGDKTIVAGDPLTFD